MNTRTLILLAIIFSLSVACGQEVPALNMKSSSCGSVDSYLKEISKAQHVQEACEAKMIPRMESLLRSSQRQTIQLPDPAAHLRRSIPRTPDGGKQRIVEAYRQRFPQAQTGKSENAQISEVNTLWGGITAAQDRIRKARASLQAISNKTHAPIEVGDSKYIYPADWPRVICADLVIARQVWSRGNSNGGSTQERESLKNIAEYRNTGENIFEVFFVNLQSNKKIREFKHKRWPSEILHHLINYRRGLLAVKVRYDEFARRFNNTSSLENSERVIVDWENFRAKTLALYLKDREAIIHYMERSLDYRPIPMGAGTKFVKEAHRVIYEQDSMVPYSRNVVKRSK